MIYLYDWSKKNIYTKLDDVLNIKNSDNPQKEYYEELGKTTKTNYKNFTKKMRDKQSRPSIIPFKKPIYQQNSTSAYFNINKIKSPDRVYDSDLIRNSESCVEEIEKHFRKSSIYGISKEKEVKIEDFRLKYKKEEDNFIDQVNFKVERNKKIFAGGELETEQNSNSHKRTHSIVVKRREINHKLTNLKKKFAKVIFGALSYLFYNNISVIDYMQKNPIPTKAYSFKYSLEFFEAVKFNKIDVVEDILKLDKEYLFDFDYFEQTAYHWAAKRGFKDLLELLIRKGVHVNLFDYNKRTPLFLAALNNHRDICLILISYGANPFLEDKERKKPIDVTTDPVVKQLLLNTMESKSEINGSNYFKEKILRKHKEDVANIFNKGKQRISSLNTNTSDIIR